MQFLGRWAYQKPIVDFSLARLAVALFCEQGVGKTWITAGILDDLIHDDYEALLIAPLGTIIAHDGWRFVLGKIDINVCLNFEEYKKAKTPKILLINFESIQPRHRKQSKKNPKPRGQSKSQKLAKWIKANEWSFCGIDESQKIKARNGKGSKVLGGIKHSDYRLILTGTPFDDVEDPQEIWAQWRFLDSNLFGSNWKTFADEYLERCGWMGKQWRFKEGSLEKIKKMIAPYSLRVTKKVLNLEDIDYRRVVVPMFGRQRKLYRDIDKKNVAIIDGAKVTAKLRMVKDVRLQQVCGGFVEDDEGELHEFGSAKLRVVKNLLKKVDFPVIIYAKYLNEVSRIVSTASSGKFRVATITGKNRRTRGKTIKDFQDGKIDILVSQIRSGGVGINLPQAKTGIIYSTTFSWIDFDQAISRMHRPGQKNKVKIFLLIAQFSIDKDIYHKILSKCNVSNAFLSWFKSKETVMAKKGSTKTKSTEEKTEKKAKKRESSKYNINHLADKLGVEPASVRVQLRKLSVEKAGEGGRYGWDNKEDMMEVYNLIKSSKAKATKAKAKEEEEEEDDDE